MRKPDRIKLTREFAHVVGRAMASFTRLPVQAARAVQAVVTDVARLAQRVERRLDMDTRYRRALTMIDDHTSEGPVGALSDVLGGMNDIDRRRFLKDYGYQLACYAIDQRNPDGLDAVLRLPLNPNVMVPFQAHSDATRDPRVHLIEYAIRTKSEGCALRLARHPQIHIPADILPLARAHGLTLLGQYLTAVRGVTPPQLGSV